MAEEQDPVESAASEGRDLYDVASWEPRTRLDRVSASLYRLLARATRALVILLAVVILFAEFVLTGLATIGDPIVGVFILLSVVPALGIVVYLWQTDVTMREPLGTVLVTFALGVLFAGFAAVLNSIAGPVLGVIPFVGSTLFFYFVVAPVEETVKWLAIRLYAYDRPAFNAVIDGAVYGAVAGLGFATIENAVYIGGQYLEAAAAGNATFAPTFSTAAIRTFAGPGHVIYSAFAGYYLGLAKYNREQAGPIVLKGLLIAVFAHGTYNTLVGIVPGLVTVVTGIDPAIAFIGFVIVYDAILGYFLYRKVSRYRAAYRATNGDGATSSDADRPTAPNADHPEGGGPESPGSDTGVADGPATGAPIPPEEGTPGDQFQSEYGPVESPEDRRE